MGDDLDHLDPDVLFALIVCGVLGLVLMILIAFAVSHS